LLKTALTILFSGLVFIAYGQELTSVFRDREQSPRVELLRSSDSSVIELRIKPRGVFSRIQTERFTLDSWSSYNQALQQIEQRLNRHNIAQDIEGAVLQRVRQIGYTGQRECQVIHVGLENPIEQSGLAQILEVLAPGSKHFRGPSGALEPVLLGQLDLQSQNEAFDLYVNIDSEGSPTSLSLITQRGDFRDFSIERDGQRIHLWSPRRDRILTLETSPVGVRQSALAVDIIIPTAANGLQNVRRERHLLVRDHQQWINPNPEAQSAHHGELWVEQRDELRNSLGALFDDYEDQFIYCMNHKVGLSLSQSESGLARDCRGEIEAELKVRNTLNEIGLELSGELLHSLRICIGGAQVAGFEWGHPINQERLQECLDQTSFNANTEKRTERFMSLLHEGIALPSGSKDLIVRNALQRCQIGQARQCLDHVSEWVAFELLANVYARESSECEDRLDCHRRNLVMSSSYPECFDQGLPSHPASAESLLFLYSGLIDSCERSKELGYFLSDLEGEVSQIMVLSSLPASERTHLLGLLRPHLERWVSDFENYEEFQRERTYLRDQALSLALSMRTDLVRMRVYPETVDENLLGPALVLANQDYAISDGQEFFYRSLAARLNIWSSELENEQARQMVFEDRLQRRLPGTEAHQPFAEMVQHMDRAALEGKAEFLVELYELPPERKELTLERLKTWIGQCLNELNRGLQACHQGLDAQVLTLWHQNQLELMVSQHHLLESAAGERALQNLLPFTQCLDSGKDTSLYQSAKQWHGVCATALWLDTTRSSFAQSLLQLQPLLTSDQSTTQTRSFNRCLSQATNSQLPESVTLSVLGLSAGTREERVQASVQITTQLARLMSESDDEFEHVQEKITECFDTAMTSMTQGVRDRLISMAPAVWGDHVNNQSREFRQVLATVVDHELLDLVLQMQRRSASHRLTLNPLDRELTPEFTMESMANMTRMLSVALSRGFVFDSQRMFNEMIVFREELKEALLWINDRETSTRLGELGEFFKSSQLADLLATAELSEQVSLSMRSYIDGLERTELADFATKTRHRAIHRLSRAEKAERDAIVLKYQSLRDLVREMTASYDFRRIIHQGTREGRELLELVKTNILLPRLLGREPTAQSMQVIKERMAELIIQDRTPGGFAERFVGTIAQSQLNQQRDDKWRITVWLFYSDNDFDWTSLRRTTSGQRAMNYYMRNILMPKMLGQSLTRYQENLRFQEFQRYLRLAQSEN
jgi:hypothetical protein